MHNIPNKNQTVHFHSTFSIKKSVILASIPKRNIQINVSIDTKINFLIIKTGANIGFTQVGVSV
jgi:hypothetical protein